MIGLDLEKLGAYLGTSGLTGELIAGGRSNLTYRVSGPDGPFIVRRPPLGHVLATAHDMAREHRIITALGPTGVPVPRTIALCEDVSVIGAPFYVMEYVAGHIYRTAAQAASLGPARLAQAAASMMGVLATLHEIDPASVGLGDFGRPAGYLERQLTRWRKQLDASRSRDLPGIDKLHERLAASAPEPIYIGIVHGDYRLDNLIMNDADQVAALLDWEMATLGDQLTDVGLLLMYWELLVTGRGMFGAPPPDARFPSDLASLYPRDTPDLNWYIAFANYKLAVIAEGIHFRYQAGQTVGEGFEKMGAAVPVLVARGHELLEG
ncbi:phosphotransferase family protein [Allorhizocola rhizosphaerae]|uniref:phosphotransferase family protein n=1 Tax=Allorhizocola rhizosphaerae TaxID=1872709 RepID=UPI000E3D5434|nr:phosphotransferase family protein [Allorhizocola rhizosphaerae]